MFVPDAARRSVVFIGSKESDGSFRPRATGFLVTAWEKNGDVLFPYLVTAEHVVSGMLTKGMDVYCRLNLRFGDTATVPLDLNEWRYHPDESNRTDVAITSFAPPISRNLIDHEAIILPNPIDQDRNCPAYGLTAPQVIGVGDEIFIIGLFRSHYGKERNVPIVRIGNIAAMPEEPIRTKYAGYIDAYLAEVRSIAGLSGSPVFVNIPEYRPNPPTIHGVKLAPDGVRDAPKQEWYRYRFLGLVHGHFDLANLKEDSVVEDGDGAAPNGINTGIGIVIPEKKVLETLYQPQLVAERLEMQAKLREEFGATADLDLSEDGATASTKRAPSTKADNLSHKEDFTRLLGAAVKSPKRDDQT